MPLPASGAISLSQIQTEFGGANPISMSEYYRNGAYTTSNNTGVPTSGQISMSQFHGTTAFVPDPVPNSVNWADISASDMIGGSAMSNNASQTISGINQTISLRANVPSCDVNVTANGSGSFTGILRVYVAGVEVASFTHVQSFNGQTIAAKSFDFNVTNGQSVYFEAEGFFGGMDGNGGFNGTVSVLNLSSGNTVLDTFLFTISAGAEGGLGDPW